MAHMTQTVVECDRCGDQYSDSEKVRQIDLQERDIVTGDLIHATNSWGARRELPDLCRDCTSELLDQLRAFGGNLGDS